jgi:hypothetical protein
LSVASRFITALLDGAGFVCSESTEDELKVPNLDMNAKIVKRRHRLFYLKLKLRVFSLRTI